MPKFATYQPHTPVSSATLNFSTEMGGILLKSGIPTEISDEQIKYLEKNNEEWLTCLRLSLIKIEEMEVKESDVAKTKILVTGETPEEVQGEEEPVSNPNEEPPEIQPEIKTTIKTSTKK